MLFREKSTGEGYHYTVDDVFGTIEFLSLAPLDAETLDALTSYVMRSGLAAGDINEEIRFTFRKADMWLEDGEETVIH